MIGPYSNKFNSVHFYHLNLVDCSIDDYQFSLFTQNYRLFPSLEYIDLERNQIKTIPNEILRFKLLKYINFGNQYPNPLSA
jgi:hypothetical protein